MQAWQRRLAVLNGEVLPRKQAKPRGRRCTRRTRLTGAGEQAYLDQVEKLRQSYYRASKLRDPVARLSVATSLAQLELHAQALTELAAQGKLVVDEVKALPSLAREIRAAQEALGLIGKRADFEEADDDDDR